MGLRAAICHNMPSPATESQLDRSESESEEDGHSVHGAPSPAGADGPHMLAAASLEWESTELGPPPSPSPRKRHRCRQRTKTTRSTPGSSGEPDSSSSHWACTTWRWPRRRPRQWPLRPWTFGAPTAGAHGDDELTKCQMFSELLSELYSELSLEPSELDLVLI